jgi:hypothetical protein
VQNHAALEDREDAFNRVCRDCIAGIGPNAKSYRDDKGKVMIRFTDGSTMSWKSAISGFRVMKA